MAKKRLSLVLFLFVLVLASSCRTEFEKIRTGNDVELKYQKALEFYDNEDWYKAQILFEQITGIFRGDPRIEEIYFKYSYTHFNLKKYILASYYFKNFFETFPNSAMAEEAMFMSAFSNQKMSPSFRLDQTTTHQAIEEFQLFVNSFPQSSRVDEANQLIDLMREKLEQKAMAEADLYFKLEDYEAANHSYQNFLKDFPDAMEIERSRFMVLKSFYRQATNTIELLQIERFEDTIDAYYEFVDRHPNSGWKKEAESIFQASSDRIKKLKETTK